MVPTTSWLWAANGSMILGVRFHVRETAPIVPPLNFPIRPLVYEQTADITGALWERTPQGDGRLLTTFADTGFKEYTSVTVASPP